MQFAATVSKDTGLQAPLLAYNHFVEALFVLNDCREGVHGGAGIAMTDGGADGRHLKGASPAMRAKRDAIYRRGPAGLMCGAHWALASSQMQHCEAPRKQGRTQAE